MKEVYIFSEVPATLPPTKEIDQIATDLLGMHVVGLVTACDLQEMKPSHAAVIGIAPEAESYKAWQRALSMVPNHHGLLKIELALGGDFPATSTPEEVILQ